MEFFEYGQTEIDHLKSRDKKLAAAIDRFGTIKREVTPDLFTALVKSVVAQQISTKAAETVWGRLCAQLTAITPDNIAAVEVSEIQKCGLSMRKAGYIKGLGDASLCGKLDLLKLGALPDAEIIKKLLSLNGLGVWTAEMILIFSLCRPDVVSRGDLAIRRGMMNLYGLKNLTEKQFDRYRKRYSPYGSVASLYLWAISV